MPSVYKLKPRFQALLRPISDALARSGITANQVTVAAALLSAGAGAAIYASRGARWALALVPVVCLVRMAMNAIDGMLAREHDQRSKLGALLNELGDVLSDAALYLPFALAPAVPRRLVVALVVLGIAGEMAGVVAQTIGASRRYDGPFGKSDRALFFSVLALLVACGWIAPRWLGILFGAAVALAALTIWRRGRAALREAEAAS